MDHVQDSGNELLQRLSFVVKSLTRGHDPCDCSQQVSAGTVVSKRYERPATRKVFRKQQKGSLCRNEFQKFNIFVAIHEGDMRCLGVGLHEVIRSRLRKFAEDVSITCLYLTAPWPYIHRYVVDMML
jgi:hypothetical protein